MNLPVMRAWTRGTFGWFSIALQTAAGSPREFTWLLAGLLQAFGRTLTG